MNCIADYSNFKELLIEFADFNKDYIQAYINDCISKNIVSFS